jgi:hypothetical protein
MFSYFAITYAVDSFRKKRSHCHRSNVTHAAISVPFLEKPNQVNSPSEVEVFKKNFGDLQSYVMQSVSYNYHYILKSGWLEIYT